MRKYATLLLVLSAVMFMSYGARSATITGSTFVCNGFTTALSVDTTGGVWSSSNTSKATVDGSGVVTGITVGSFVISYSLPGAVYTYSMFVMQQPLPVSGSGVACAGGTTLLTDIMAGGTWSSSNTSVATIGTSTGIVAGVSAGTSEITYHYWTGCKTTKVVTVNGAPSAIGGSLSVCAGSTGTLSSSPGGGTWSSSNTAGSDDQCVDG